MVTARSHCQPPIGVGLNPFSMAALDYNGDGNTDLAVDNYNYNASPNPHPARDAPDRKW